MAANAGSIGWGMAWSGSGQTLAYRRSAFQKINGFEAVTERISGDDMHLIQAIGGWSDAGGNAQCGMVCLGFTIRHLLLPNEFR